MMLPSSRDSPKRRPVGTTARRGVLRFLRLGASKSGIPTAQAYLASTGEFPRAHSGQELSVQVAELHGKCAARAEV